MQIKNIILVYIFAFLMLLFAAFLIEIYVPAGSEVRAEKGYNLSISNVKIDGLVESEKEDLNPIITFDIESQNEVLLPVKVFTQIGYGIPHISIIAENKFLMNIDPGHNRIEIDLRPTGFMSTFKTKGYSEYFYYDIWITTQPHEGDLKDLFINSYKHEVGRIYPPAK